MSQTQEAPSTPDAERHPAGKMGRGIVIGIVVALAWIIAVAGVFVWRYKPLQGSSLNSLTPSLDPFNGNNTLLVTRYRDGQPTGYILDIRNAGRFGVTITGLAPQAGPHSLIQTVSVLVARMPNACCSSKPDDVMPFRPFALPPGESRAVLIRQRFANCGSVPAGVVQTFPPPVASFRFLGVTKHSPVGPWRIRVTSPPDSACPGR